VNDAYDRAMKAAKEADHIVLTLGLTPNLEGESMTVNAEGFDGGDRTSIELPSSQRQLLDAVAKLNKPTVIVLTTGSAISFDDSKADAVLLTWYYGQRGADAVADALLGINNPAGRLPITFYRMLDGLPGFKDYSMENRTYKYYKGKPLYAFGHGLSYTTFEYGKVELSADSAKSGETVSVNVEVKNAGDRDGDEVVQVYATALNPPVPMPLKQLVGFKRVSFKAGESKVVEIEVPVELLHRWDEKKNDYVVDPGKWQIAVGPASDQPVLTTMLNVVR
jgi:beta-glucosidase